MSRSWADLHTSLAEHGVAYAAKGSGAVFIVNGIVLKASTCRAIGWWPSAIARRCHLIRTDGIGWLPTGWCN
ncbi:hypothetical protein [Methylorubrum thiocyanatum]|uniref:hypothetical protein n=1 Tax=Methylorubrum thiocyanatum TaxID=47958 RepID=UPI003570E363